MGADRTSDEFLEPVRRVVAEADRVARAVVQRIGADTEQLIRNRAGSGAPLAEAAEIIDRITSSYSIDVSSSTTIEAITDQ